MKKHFLKDDKGQLSLTRLCTLLLVVSGIVFVFINPEHYVPGVEMIDLGLLGKVAQKQIEKTIT